VQFFGNRSGRYSEIPCMPSLAGDAVISVFIGLFLLIVYFDAFLHANRTTSLETLC